MAFNKVGIELCKVNLDFVIGTERQRGPAVISYYSRSQSELKQFSGLLSVSTKPIVCNGNISVSFRRNFTEGYQTVFVPIIKGKEKFYHAISINNSVGDTMILMEKGKENELFYNFLMKKFNLPLMKNWGGALFEYFTSTGYLYTEQILIENEHVFTTEIPIYGNNVPLSDVLAYVCTIDEELLKEAVTKLIKEGKICISQKPQKKLEFSDMDSYFKKYGPTLVSNLESLLNPLTDLDGEAHDFTLKDIRMYPQQIAQINGDTALLEKLRYSILNHSMGTGKNAYRSMYIRELLH